MTIRLKRFNTKYKAKPTDGFPSKLEAAVYYMLLLREKAGEIREVKRQESVVLQEGPPKIRINWKIDFSYIENSTDEKVYVEAKGVETMDFKIKLKLFRAKRIGRLELWKGRYQKPFLAEKFDPKKDAA